MSYCRYCGREIAYKRTKNERWMPCDAATGEPHFCQKEKADGCKSGLVVCQKCGRPVFRNHGKTFDYTTLDEHECRKADVTRHSKFKRMH